MSNISNRLKKLRLNMGLSQKEFADKYKINIRTLQDWELGRHEPPPYAFYLITRIIELEQRAGDTND